MKKTKSKTDAANVPVPQCDRDATETVARIGAIWRDLLRIEQDLNDKIGGLTEAATYKANPLKREERDLLAGLQMYCEANRARLTGNFARKSAELGTGRVMWRWRPPKVALRDKVEVILERLKTLGFKQFVRVKEEIDKEAMLKDDGTRALASTVAGVSIASAGEDFVVEPLEAEVAEVKS